jgi:hypothetical protein
MLILPGTIFYHNHVNRGLFLNFEHLNFDIV